MNIRTKFLLWFNSANFLVIILFSLVTYLGAIHSMEEGIDNRLHSVAEATSYIMERPPQGGAPLACGTREFEDILAAFLGYSGSEGFVRIVDTEGRMISCTSSPLFPDIKLNPKEMATLKINKHFYKDYGNPQGLKDKKIRVLFFPITYQSKFSGYVEVGGSLAKLESMKSSLLKLFTVIIPLILLVSNIGGILIFNKGLRPIMFLSSELKNITANELYKRLPLPSSKDEIRELFESINEMIARLEKSFEQVRQFSGDASHELRTPLTIMKGEVEVAMRSERTVEEYQDILVSVLEEIERMTRIIEDLLLIAKSDSKEMIIEKRNINLKDILCELCEQLCMFAENKDVTLNCSDMDDLMIMADPLRVRQVFVNIIENAIKYNVQGGSVNVSLHELEKGIVVEVRDTGIGIRKEDSGKIFDRFYRADKSRKREIGGAGLGLSICKWIIEGHGGHIVVDSQFGKGSIFKIWLPKS
jgi:heavy metal sensor kinase